MAFGGYKFKGYKVVRANLVTNTQQNWALLLHQVRIKALMESCALSGAQWHFSKTNGTLSFESYGNVIYEKAAPTDPAGTSYLSFFQYGNENKYYMICTLFGVQSATATSSTGYLVISRSSCPYYFYSSSKTNFGSLCSVLSLDDFTEDGPFDNYPAKALYCTPYATDFMRNTPVGSGPGSTTESAIGNVGTVYFGYATKGSDIIQIGFYNNISSTTYTACVESIGGFSEIYSPTDTNNIFKCVMSNRTTGEGYVSVSGDVFNQGHCETITGLGQRSGADSSVEGGSSIGAWFVGLYMSGKSTFTGSSTVLPYESFMMLRNGKGSQMNNEDILAKGIINSELMVGSCHIISSGEFPAFGSTTLAGNLLSLGRTVGATGFSPIQVSLVTNQGVSVYIAAYLGWDPSNPSILDESSWPELALQ